MLIWQGVIGKMIGFMTSKLIGKRIDLALDEKKKAARAFVKLYFAMEQLEEITSRLIEHLENVQSGNEIYIRGGALLYISQMIDANTWVFLDSVEDLRRVIGLYDPVLSAELVQLSTYKASFLMNASETFKVEEDPTNNHLFVTYSKPADKFLTIDFDETYEWLKAREDLYDVRDVFEWPQNFVVRYCIEEDDLETAVVKLDDTHAVMKFFEMLKQHSAVLSAGKERLRSLIISQFKAEDILFVSKGLR